MHDYGGHTCLIPSATVLITVSLSSPVLALCSYATANFREAVLPSALKRGQTTSAAAFCMLSKSTGQMASMGENRMHKRTLHCRVFCTSSATAWTSCDGPGPAEVSAVSGAFQQSQILLMRRNDSIPFIVIPMEVHRASASAHD